MKKMLKTMLLGLLFVSPMIIGMEQRAPAAALAQTVAPAPRTNLVATAELEELLEKGDFTEDDWTAIVRLLDNGADINVKNNYGNTVLMWAVVDNNIEMVRELLDRGADINIQNIDGNTVLMWAVVGNNIEMVRELLDRDADINIQNIDGDTASTLAADRGNISMVVLIRGCGANIVVQNKNCTK